MAGSSLKMDPGELKAFLDEKVRLYNRPEFIATDPIQIPHRYEKQEDIEIAAFLTAILAWGRKASIIASADKLLSRMPGSPHLFLTEADEEDLEYFLPFVHRTFNGFDCIYFLRSLRRIYREHGGLGRVFQDAFQSRGDAFGAITEFRRIFFREDPGRSSKHLPDPERGSAAKRIHMYLRWMVRKDAGGVDFGLWKDIPMAALQIPLDVHTGSVGRKLGLLNRKQNDRKAVEELSLNLQLLDPTDPIRYDFALFGLGSFEGF